MRGADNAGIDMTDKRTKAWYQERVRILEIKLKREEDLRRQHELAALDWKLKHERLMATYDDVSRQGVVANMYIERMNQIRTLVEHLSLVTGAER
jgi:hypothetical protein